MSVAFYGDYDTTETVYIPFNTFSSDDPSASVTITNLVAGDVEIHKDGSTTQRASDNGVTVTINFDGVTGNHLVSIDLSDNSDAGYYANGSRYQVRIEGATVDGGTINAWIGSFSIGCTLRPTTAGRTLDVETGGCAGIDWANVANPTTALDLSGTDIQLCDTVTTLTGHTAQTGDNYTRLGAPAGASVSADIAANQADLNTILADTNELQTDWTDGGRLDLLIDAIKAKTDNQPAGIPKNVALSNFEFLMIDSSDHITPKTGLTVAGTISKDGGAFGALTNSVSEIANGVYKVNITQTEMNADVITLKFTATGADQRTITIKTST